jgi:ParB-like chromosome segregation protein Spo0J
MAKPRLQSADITHLMGKGPPTTGDEKGTPPGGVDSILGTARSEGAHPVRDRSDAGVARSDHALLLHPDRVVRRGRYVRPFTEDRRFRDLLAAIQEAGNVVHVPILVRIEGMPGAIEYVLVDGTHRLEAARRLNITIPALNLGRVSAEQALAIQAMANEVRASMHVVDQAAYVVALATRESVGEGEGEGLTREAIQRTTGFSAGRVSELLAIGQLIATLSEADRARARRASRVTYRALRALKAIAIHPEAFRAGVLTLVEDSEAEALDEREGDQDDPRGWHAPIPEPGALRGGPLADSREAPHSGGGKRAARGTPAPGAGFTFVPTKNSRGTSVTYRIAWRARAVRADPDGFLAHVRNLLRAIAEEATAQYEDALTRLPQGRRATLARTIEREEAELADTELVERDTDAMAVARASDAGIPESENPMPVPLSRRGDLTPPEGEGIDPRLLTGLSLPMLARRMRETRDHG